MQFSKSLKASKNMWRIGTPEHLDYRVCIFFTHMPATYRGPPHNIGSSPITARTRSARRSNPQRMSVASADSQIRCACASSSDCRLGSPITPAPRSRQSPSPNEHHRNQPGPSPCGHWPDELQSLATGERLARSHLPMPPSARQNLPAAFPSAAASTHKNRLCVCHRDDRTP